VEKIIKKNSYMDFQYNKWNFYLFQIDDIYYKWNDFFNKTDLFTGNKLIGDIIRHAKSYFMPIKVKFDENDLKGSVKRFKKLMVLV
jgi:hypothetical protein